MTTAFQPFEPQGVVAIWRTIYDAMPTVPGQVMTYERIMEVTELDRDQARKHIARAIRELEHRHQRTMRCIPNVGYEVVASNEHAHLARRQLKLGRRRVRRGLQIIEATNTEDLDPHETQRLESIAERASNILTACGRKSR